VDNEIGAAGSTGRGEANLLACSSVMIIEKMHQGKLPERACLAACERRARMTKESRLRMDNGRPKLKVTFYAINKKSEFGIAAIWSGSRFAFNEGQSESRLAGSAYL
jgi:N4-(beta-N-acetylglucosaminyl)-L-asparaginase